MKQWTGLGTGVSKYTYIHNIYDLEFPFFYLENLIDILSLKLSVSKSILLEIYSVSQKKNQTTEHFFYN